MYICHVVCGASIGLLPKSPHLKFSLNLGLITHIGPVCPVYHADPASQQFWNGTRWQKCHGRCRGNNQQHSWVTFFPPFGHHVAISLVRQLAVLQLRCDSGLLCPAPTRLGAFLFSSLKKFLLPVLDFRILYI